MNLNTLGRKYGTDKVNHGFLKVYEELFENFKNEEMNFLEIGVFFGSSIKMWREYLPKSKIFGLDHFTGYQGNGNRFNDADKYYNEWSEKENKENIELFVVDQSKEDNLENFAEYCKMSNIKFKVIIDDGSHLMYDQQITFIKLFELLEPNGYYIIEDIHTSEQEGYDLFNDKSNSTKKIFMDMKDGKRFNSVYSNENNEYINDNVKEIKLFRNAAWSQTLSILKK